MLLCQFLRVDAFGTKVGKSFLPVSDPKRAALGFNGRREADAGDVGDFGYDDRFTFSVRIIPRVLTGTILSRMPDEAQAEGYSVELVEGWHQCRSHRPISAFVRISRTMRDLRIAEVRQLDLQIENGEVKAYRAKVAVSFKYAACQDYVK